VKRQVPQSHGSACMRMAQGRGESLEEMLGTDEARVLVVEAVGKQKSVGTHRGRASRYVARQAVEGRPSLEQAVEAADAGDGGASVNADGSLRVEWWGAQAFTCSAEMLGETGVRAKRCAGIRPNCHRGGTVRGSVWRRKTLGPRG